MGWCGRIFRIIFLLLVVNFSVTAQPGSNDYQYALIEAVKQKNIGNLPGAIELYKMVLEENDSVAVAHYELGTLYAMVGREERAVFHSGEAYNLDPDNYWFFNSYIDILILGEEYNAAEILLNEKIETETDNLEYIFRVANIQFLKGNARRAIRVLNRMEKSYGVSDKIILLKANIYESEKNYSRALKEIDKIIEIFPESAEFMIVAAELAMESKNSDLATYYYENVFDLDSSNVYAITNLTDYYRKKGNYTRSFYFLNKSFKSDEIAYEKKMSILTFYLSDQSIIDSNPDDLEMLIRTMLQKYHGRREIHLFGADFYLQQIRYEEALESIIPILTPGENRFELWRQGILLANVTDNKISMMDLSKAAYEIFPDSSDIIYFKAIAEFEVENYQACLNTLSEVNMSKLDSPDVVSQARILRAESSSKLELFNTSDSLFRIIISEEPDNFMVMNNFSYYLALRGESLDEAKELIEKVILNNPENDTYLDTYAWVLFKLGEFEKAEEMIIKALNHGGDIDPVVNEHAADIHRALGSYSISKAFYQKAITLGGDQDRLLKKLESISSCYEK